MEGLLAIGQNDEAAALYDPSVRPVVEGCFVPTAWSSDCSVYASLGAEVVAQLCFDVNRSAIALCAGDVEQAQAILEKITANCPGFNPAIKGLVFIHLKKNNQREAIRLLINFVAR